MDEKPKRELPSWKAEVEIPPRFQAEVWQRIAARDTARRSSFWHQLSSQLSAQLAKPAYATAIIVAGVAMSLGVAHTQAQSANARHWRQLETRYVASINPAVQAESFR